MQHIDALSRIAMIVHTKDPDNELRILKLMQQRDRETSALIEACESDDSSVDRNFILKNDIVCYLRNEDALLVCPRSLRYSIAQTSHDDNRHVGLEKLLRSISTAY